MECRVQVARLEDVAAIAEIYGFSVMHSTATFELEPPGVEEMERRLVAVQQGGLPYFVAESDGVVVGYGYASQFRPRAGYRFTVEDSIYVRAEYAGRGVGRRLLTTLVEACRAAGFKQMVAVMGGENPASVALHAQQGFAPVGVLRRVGFKFDAWQDVTLMQRAL
ncbi:MAG TPA: GNAT family N-acetyltransferase [Edaphobacter sp.]|jgi:L-amino acid N-acyltransferase YncA|nr:GNAT family N-acetyltransferase [Edaphobacter sp.]